MIIKSGPILLIDDDTDDQEIATLAIEELGITNKVICFSTCHDAFDYLMAEPDFVQPFVILCDVNLPKMTGIELKQKIDDDPKLRKKSIPFIFYSTASDKTILEKVYEYRVQGYFIKGSSIKDIKDTFSLIFTYWTKCRHPNN